MKLEPNNLHLKFIEQLIGKTIQTDAYIDYSQAQNEWNKKEAERLASLPHKLTCVNEDRNDERIFFLEERKVCPVAFKILRISDNIPLLGQFFWLETDKGILALSFEIIHSLISTGEALQYGIYQYKIIHDGKKD